MNTHRDEEPAGVLAVVLLLNESQLIEVVLDNEAPGDEASEQGVVLPLSAERFSFGPTGYDRAATVERAG